MKEKMMPEKKVKDGERKEEREGGKKIWIQ